MIEKKLEERYKWKEIRKVGGLKNDRYEVYLTNKQKIRIVRREEERNIQKAYKVT